MYYPPILCISSDYYLAPVAPTPEVSKPVDPQARVHAAMFDPLNQQSDSKAVDQFDQIGRLSG